MRPLTPSQFVLRRLSGDWKLLLIAFLGVVVATSLIAGTPIYLKTLARLGLNQAIERATPLNVNVFTSARDIQLAREDIERVEESAGAAFLNNIPEIYRGHELSLMTNPHLFNPSQVIPEPRIALALSPEQAAEQAAVKGSLAYLTNFLGLEDNVTVVEGRMAGDDIEMDPEVYPPIAAIVEAVIGAPVARAHGLGIGDVLTLATPTTARDWTRVSARIVGMIEATDPSADYWQGRDDVFFDPPALLRAPEVGVEIDPFLPPAALIISPSAAIVLPRELVDVSRRQRRRSVDGVRTAIIPEPKVVMALSAEQVRRQARMTGSLGYLVHLEDLLDHVTLVDGRMAGDTITVDPETQSRIDRIVEAVVGVQVARRHDLHVGDLVTLTPSAQFWSRVSARIVGIVDVTDPSEEYWQGRSSMFFDPPPLERVPDLGVEVDPEQPPAAFIISPEAAPKLTLDLVAPPSYDSANAAFVHMTNLAEHVTLLAGRMPDDSISYGPRGPIVEAMLTEALGLLYGVGMDDEVIVTPFLDEPVRVTVTIVGIVRRDDPLAEYWQSSFAGFFEPPPPSPPPPAPPEPLPPLPLVVHENILVDAIGNAYEGTLVNAEWLTYVDKEKLKQMSIRDIRLGLDDLDNEFVGIVPSHDTFTGITIMLFDFERRIFLARIPLLLLLTTMVVAVLYFLAMMVSYLVQRRESDLAALKTRGVGILHIVRLYGTEGFIIAAAAVAVAPFIAMGATALAGRLPYFRELTGGDFLPVQWSMLSFLMAIGAGLLCLTLLLAPVMLSARAGQLAQRLRSSRPPSVPFFHRYHLDLGLLLIGGLIFWELRSREELVVGGLFKDAQINEALLLAPVLFLTVVALVFIRFFPLVLRFVSGESSALLHLVFAATVAPLGAAIAVREAVAGNGLAWAAPVGVLAALAVAYWGTQRVGGGWRLVGLALQAVTVGLFVLQEPPVMGTLNVVSTAILGSIVPSQLVFLLFRALSRRSPAWVSLALWSMTRNPLQYTWLVLLLVLVTGLATFATTIGATLDRKDEERILYGVATDIRVTGARTLDGWALRERYLAVPGVSSVSPAYRGAGAGLPDVSRSFKTLGVRSEEFASMSWYRDDFSTRPLAQVMQGLRTENTSKPLAVPDGATDIGMWAKLTPTSTALTVQMLLMDGRGALSIVRLGRLMERDWHLMSARVPVDLESPVHLVSVRVRPSSEFVSSPGSIVLDDIHVTMGANGESIILDDFERRNGWTAMPTSLKGTESVFEMSDDAHQGDGAGSYSYGAGANGGVPGIYLSPSGGPLPVAISTTMMGGAEDSVGTQFIGTVNSRLVSMVVSDTVEYFPTMDPEKGGFVIADMDLLLGHLSIANPAKRYTPNEFFFALDSAAGPNTLARIRQLTPFTAQILDGEAMTESMLASISLDPLVTAGWRAMALLSIAIVLFAGGTGYVTYLLFFADRSGGEMDLLRSLGLRHRQVIGLLSLEHLVMVLVGIGLGVWAGLQMSILTVPSVSLPEGSSPILPPVLVTVDWWVLGAVCGALVIGFVQMVLLLNRRIFRSDLRGISRRNEA